MENFNSKDFICLIFYFYDLNFFWEPDLWELVLKIIYFQMNEIWIPWEPNYNIF